MAAEVKKTKASCPQVTPDRKTRKRVQKWPAASRTDFVSPEDEADYKARIILSSCPALNDFGP